MKISETFQKTKEVLLDRGWYKGFWTGDNGKLCILGALSAAGDGRTWLRNVKFLNTFAVEKGLVPTGRSIALWNDNPTTSFNNVLDLLDEAIIAAKEQGL